MTADRIRAATREVIEYLTVLDGGPAVAGHVARAKSVLRRVLAPARNAADAAKASIARFLAPVAPWVEAHAPHWLLRVLRVGIAVFRFAKRRTPKWLVRVLAVCVVIPGPFDEMAALAVLIVVVTLSLLRSASRRVLCRSVRLAWNA